MSVESFTTAVSPAHARRTRGSRLVGAEFLKLRKRRGLVLSSLGLTVVPMLVGYTVVAVQHASDPDRHGPGGGVENFLPSIGLLSGLVAIVAILIGVTTGTGDLRAGVFRELVITGRSRLSLFAARIPGGLALLLPFAAAGFVTAAVASIVLADGEPTPGFRLLVLTGAWIGLAAALTFVLALGVSSVVGSTGPSVAILVGWQLLLGPLLPALDSLGFVRDLLPGAGVTAIAPEALEVQSGLSMTHAAIAANIALWTVVPLAAGAWRTNTRDA